MSSHMSAKAKRWATELGTRVADFARRPFKRELDASAPQGDFESVCGMVSGTPFDIARDGLPMIGTSDNPHCG